MDSETEPQNTRDLNKLLRRLGATENQIARRSASFNDQLQKLIAQHTKTAEPLLDRQEHLTDLVEAYAAVHMDELVKPGTKTAWLSHGKIEWRTASPSVEIDESRMKEIFHALRRRRLFRKFTIPQPAKLNKKALSENPDLANKLPGVSVSRKTRMSIKPKDSLLGTIDKGSPYRRVQKSDG